MFMHYYTERNIGDIEPYNGFTRIETAIFRDNDITPDEVLNTIPDKYGEFQTDTEFFQFLLQNLSPLKGTDEFIRLIWEHKQDTIAIIGDYDTDGIMATVILRILFDKLGFKSFHIVPNRILDGYSVQKKHIDMAIERGAKLIITVDNGIIGTDEAAYAKSMGLDYIITDHHKPNLESPNGIPKADVIIDPHYSEDIFRDSCGAAVAMKIAIATLLSCNCQDQTLMNHMITMAGIATIGDMVKIVGENRLIVIHAINILNSIQDSRFFNRLGKLILEFLGPAFMRSDGKSKFITEDDIAFYLSPTLNAQGRVYGDVNELIEKIIKCDKDRTWLSGYRAANVERKSRIRTLVNTITPTDDLVDVIILNNKDFDFPLNGLAGLLANRIAIAEHKPVFIGFQFETNRYKLSGRSVNGYSIYDALQRIIKQHPDFKVVGGGHNDALGVELSSLEDVEKFKQYIIEDYKNFEAYENKPIVYNFTIEDRDEAIQAHDALAPFGIGFKRLVFKYTGKLKSKNLDRNTLKIGDMTFKFYGNIMLDTPEEGTVVDVLFSLVHCGRFTEFKINELIY